MAKDLGIRSWWGLELIKKAMKKFLFMAKGRDGKKSYFGMK